MPALIKPELITWARKSARLTVDALAEKLATTRQVVLEWEAGTKELSVPQLRKIADACKRPLAVFYLDEPPLDFDAAKLPDFPKTAAGEYFPTSPTSYAAHSTGRSLLSNWRGRSSSSSRSTCERR